MQCTCQFSTMLFEMHFAAVVELTVREIKHYPMISFNFCWVIEVLLYKKVRFGYISNNNIPQLKTTLTEIYKMSL